MVKLKRQKILYKKRKHRNGADIDGAKSKRDKSARFSKMVYA